MRLVPVLIASAAAAAAALPFASLAQEGVHADLSAQVSASGLPGGWAGTIADHDMCAVAVELYAVEGGRIKYQVHVIGNGVLTPPVFYDIVAVDGHRITVREEGHTDNETVSIEGDQLTTNSGQPRHRCPA